MDHEGVHLLEGALVQEGRHALAGGELTALVLLLNAGFTTPGLGLGVLGFEGLNLLFEGHGNSRNSGKGDRGYWGSTTSLTQPGPGRQDGVKTDPGGFGIYRMVWAAMKVANLSAHFTSLSWMLLMAVRLTAR